MIGTEFQQEILNRLSRLGPIYIVGGAVRDEQLGIPAKDVDAVMALPLPEIEEKLSDWGYKPHVIGAHQQTVSLFQGTDRVDIAAFSGEVEANALVRDFTVNAIYQDVRSGEIKDPLGGLQDLREGRLKACGRAAERYKEDPLRIMRLIRLAVSYGFAIEQETWLAAVEHVSKLRHVSAERITEEFGRILILDKVDMALGLLEALGYFRTCIPELARLKGLGQNNYHTKDAWEHTREVVKNSRPRLDLRLAALFHDLGKWETASRECNVAGIIRLIDQGYEVDGFKLKGKNLERWANKKVEINGGRLDNYPNTILVKRIQSARATQREHLEMVPNGKRHFLQHERESVRLVNEILPRFRWSMLLPGGRRGERELAYIISQHMLGTITFGDELKGGIDQTKLCNKARRFAWKVGWNGQVFNKQRIENLLDLWHADFLGGKQDAAENIDRLAEIQGEIRKASVFLAERANLLNWAQFEEFSQGKGLVGERFGKFKEQVRYQVMMYSKNRLTDPQFLEREYKLYWKSSSETSAESEFKENT